MLSWLKYRVRLVGEHNPFNREILLEPMLILYGQAVLGNHHIFLLDMVKFIS